MKMEREVDLFQRDEQRRKSEGERERHASRTDPRVRAKFLVFRANFGKERCQEPITRKLDLVGSLDFFGSPLSGLPVRLPLIWPGQSGLFSSYYSYEYG